MVRFTSLLRRLRWAALGAVVLMPGAVVSAASPADAAPVQQPIGFERSVDPAASCGGQASGVEFDLTLSDIYEDYAAQMTIGLPADEPQFQQKDRRLIDIEVHSDGSGLANHVYDVVWVCNQGDFELESWLVPGLTETEVNQLTSIDSIAILDIERYPEGQEWRFSAIVQRNAGKFAWDVMLATNTADITAEARRLNARVVDVDYNYPCTPGVFCGSIVDAVLIENTGTNFMPTFDLFTGFPGSIPPGNQMTDIELHAGIPQLTNWVASGNTSTVLHSDDTDEVVQSHSDTGRIVDLEVQAIKDRDSLGSTFVYHTVHVTNQ